MSNWQPINQTGSILIMDHLQDAPAIRNARKFLKETTISFAKQCVSFYDIVGEFPFIYRERQLHSALFPAIAKVSDAAFMEQPVTRKTKDMSGHVWLDYWIVYGTTIFLIELKHSWNAIKTETIKETTQESWTEAINQLKKIHKEDIYNLSITANSVAKIALMVVPFYQSSKSKENLQTFDREETKQAIHTFINGLNPKPNWSCVWLLHREYQKEPFNFGDRIISLFGDYSDGEVYKVSYFFQPLV